MWPWHRRSGGEGQLAQAREKARGTARVVEAADRETERAKQFSDANRLMMVAAELLGIHPKGKAAP